MQNYRVEVQNHGEAMEAQDLFLEIGFKKSTLLEDGYPKCVVADQVSLTGGKESGGAHISFVGTNYKKITLPELRAMVAPNQKEYLVKTDTGYTLQVLSDVIEGHDGIIEVPEGAEILTACGLALYFWNKTNNTTWVDGEGWVSCDNERLCTLKSYLGDKDVKIVWQRESLNDQVASAEKARQEQAQVRELSECDLIDSGKLIIGGLGESFPVGLEHHKFIQPEGFSEGGFIPKQNHGAPVGLLHHGFSGFIKPEELPFVDDEPKLRNIKIRVNGNLDKAVETIQSMGYWNCQFNRIPSDCYWLVGNSDATVDYGSEQHMYIDHHVEYFVDGAIDKTQETLNDRQSTYGDFKDVAQTTEQLFQVIKGGASFVDFTDEQRMALYMICSKIARLTNGDVNYIESWHDISGYATLIENSLSVTDGSTNARLVYQKVINGKIQDI